MGFERKKVSPDPGLEWKSARTDQGARARSRPLDGSIN